MIDTELEIVFPVFFIFKLNLPVAVLPLLLADVEVKDTFLALIFVEQLLFVHVAVFPL